MKIWFTLLVLVCWQGLWAQEPLDTIYSPYHIVEYRYWFDANYTPQPATYQAGTVQIDVSALSEGFHTLHYQLTDSRGSVSPARTTSFYRVATALNQITADYDVTGVRYWFDANYTPQSTTYQAGTVQIDVSALSEGFHTLHYQLTDSRGGVSPARTTSFYRVATALNQITADYDVTGVRYWFDANYTPQSTTYQAGTVQIDVSALSEGFHTLHYQLTDSRGGVSPARTTSFLRMNASLETIYSDYELSHVRYWFDQDANLVKTTDYAAGLCAIDASQLSAGNHTLYYQVVAGDGSVSPVQTATFEVTSVIRISENEPVSFLTDIEDADIALTLSVESQMWDAIVLPFDLSSQQVKDMFGQKALVATLIDERDSVLLFRTSLIGTMANQPFLLRPDTTATTFLLNGIHLCKPEEQTVNIGNHQMTGCYRPGLVTDRSAHLFANGDMVQSDGNLTLKSLHAYLTNSDGRGISYEVDENDPQRIDLADWQILKQVYEENGGLAWTCQWLMGDAPTSARDLPGVKVADGRVTSIDLASCNVTGTFPFALLTLPSLEKLDLSGNLLFGDMGMSMLMYMQMNPMGSVAVQQLDISDNLLSGNIGLFAYMCPALTQLNAARNCFDELVPAFLPTVITHDVSGQHIDRTVDLRLADLAAEGLSSLLPSMMFYDDATNDFLTNIELRLFRQADGEEEWFANIYYDNGNLQIPAVATQNVYYGQSGDLLNVVDGHGNTIRVNLGFDEGDTNFNGQVDVTDLQATINYMFEEYVNKPYNFTAADLWQDENINVQDAVCLVNILLNADGSSSRMVPNARKMATRQPEACVFVEGGELRLRSAVPVSAFDIVVASVAPCTLSSALSTLGFTCALKQTGSKLHLVGYSLSGATLPAGEHTLCEGIDGMVTYAALADQDADGIQTALGGVTTKIQPSVRHARSSESYRLSLGTERAIIIDASGAKTMIKKSK